MLLPCHPDLDAAEGEGAKEDGVELDQPLVPQPAHLDRLVESAGSGSHVVRPDPLDGHLAATLPMPGRDVE